MSVEVEQSIVSQQNALEALRPFMIARGVTSAEDIPEKVRFNSLITPRTQR